jgi:hypothetical protein
MAVNFIDCTSLNISYDIMGIATINYTIVSDTGDLGEIDGILEAVDRTYTGIVTEVSMNQIPNTNWYEVHVTMLTTTD